MLYLKTPHSVLRFLRDANAPRQPGFRAVEGHCGPPDQIDADRQCEDQGLLALRTPDVHLDHTPEVHSDLCIF